MFPGFTSIKHREIVTGYKTRCSNRYTYGEQFKGTAVLSKGTGRGRITAEPGCVKLRSWERPLRGSWENTVFPDSGKISIDSQNVLNIPVSGELEGVAFK